MRIIGLDPGTAQSAIVIVSPSRVVASAMTLPNENLLEWLIAHGPDCFRNDDVLIYEKIEAMGMAVGKETFETVFWTGRFVQAWGPRWGFITRRGVKLNLCGSMKAKDANIRQALIDRYGPGKEKAIGLKKSQGPLYGIKGHEFSALAVAVTWLDHRAARGESPSDVPSSVNRPLAEGLF